MVLSIAIPVYNEAKNIGSLLHSLLRQSIGLDVEILVLSSGSTDNTNSVVRTFDGIKLYYEKHRSGKLNAVKKLANLANGEVIVFMDGDVVVIDIAEVDILVDVEPNPDRPKEVGFFGCEGRVDGTHHTGCTVKSGVQQRNPEAISPTDARRHSEIEVHHDCTIQTWVSAIERDGIVIDGRCTCQPEEVASRPSGHDHWGGAGRIHALSRHSIRTARGVEVTDGVCRSGSGEPQ